MTTAPMSIGELRELVRQAERDGEFLRRFFHALFHRASSRISPKLLRDVAEEQRRLMQAPIPSNHVSRARGSSRSARGKAKSV